LEEDGTVLKFNDEELKKFTQLCSAEDFEMKQEQKWEEEGKRVRFAIKFLALGAETHPGLRAAMSVALHNGDVSATLNEWEQVRRLVEFYLEVIIATLKFHDRSQGDPKTDHPIDTQQH